MTCRLRWYVKIETRCKIPLWRTFGRIPRHVIPEPPATLQGAATGRIQWHVILEPRITLQGAATVKKGKGAYSSSWLTSELRDATCQMRSHSVICYPNRAGWYSIYRPRKDERLSWWITVMIPEPHATLQVQSPGEINVMIVPHCRV